MADKSFGYIISKLLLGFQLRCPNCGQGKMFKDLFTMEPVCPYCGVRYERRSGESIGGMFINLGFAEVFSIGGFFITQILFNPPLHFQVIFWVVFNLAFVVLFYRHSRGMWVAISYLADEVYPDPDYKGPTVANPHGKDQP